jgi:hypothetical protein
LVLVLVLVLVLNFWVINSYNIYSIRDKLVY